MSRLLVLVVFFVVLVNANNNPQSSPGDAGNANNSLPGISNVGTSNVNDDKPNIIPPNVGKKLTRRRRRKVLRGKELSSTPGLMKTRKRKLVRKPMTVNSMRNGPVRKRTRLRRVKQIQTTPIMSPNQMASASTTARAIARKRLRRKKIVNGSSGLKIADVTTIVTPRLNSDHPETSSVLPNYTPATAATVGVSRRRQLRRKKLVSGSRVEAKEPVPTGSNVSSVIGKRTRKKVRKVKQVTTPSSNGTIKRTRQKIRRKMIPKDSNPTLTSVTLNPSVPGGGTIVKTKTRQKLRKKVPINAAGLMPTSNVAHSSLGTANNLQNIKRKTVKKVRIKSTAPTPFEHVGTVNQPVTNNPLVKTRVKKVKKVKQLTTPPGPPVAVEAVDRMAHVTQASNKLATFQTPPMQKKVKVKQRKKVAAGEPNPGLPQKIKMVKKVTKQPVRELANELGHQKGGNLIANQNEVPTTQQRVKVKKIVKHPTTQAPGLLSTLRKAKILVKKPMDPQIAQPVIAHPQPLPKPAIHQPQPQPQPVIPQPQPAIPQPQPMIPQPQPVVPHPRPKPVIYQPQFQHAVPQQMFPKPQSEMPQTVAESFVTVSPFIGTKPIMNNENVRGALGYDESPHMRQRPAVYGGLADLLGPEEEYEEDSPGWPAIPQTTHIQYWYPTYTTPSPPIPFIPTTSTTTTSTTTTTTTTAAPTTRRQIYQPWPVHWVAPPPTPRQTWYPPLLPTTTSITTTTTTALPMNDRQITMENCPKGYDNPWKEPVDLKDAESGKKRCENYVLRGTNCEWLPDVIPNLKSYWSLVKKSDMNGESWEELDVIFQCDNGFTISEESYAYDRRGEKAISCARMEPTDIPHCYNQIFIHPPLGQQLAFNPHGAVNEINCPKFGQNPYRAKLVIFCLFKFNSFFFKPVLFV